MARLLLIRPPPEEVLILIPCSIGYTGTPPFLCEAPYPYLHLSLSLAVVATYRSHQYFSWPSESFLLDPTILLIKLDSSYVPPSSHSTLPLSIPCHTHPATNSAPTLMGELPVHSIVGTSPQPSRRPSYWPTYSSSGARWHGMAQRGTRLTMKWDRWEVDEWKDVSRVGRLGSRVLWSEQPLSTCFVILPAKNEGHTKENWAGMWGKVDPKKSSWSGWRIVYWHENARVHINVKSQHLPLKKGIGFNDLKYKMGGWFMYTDS